MDNSQANAKENAKENDDTKKGAKGLIFFLLIVWALLGAIAFFWSIVCVGSSGGSTASKFFGLLIAMFFGPLWFIYKAFASKGGYCENPERRVVIERYPSEYVTRTTTNF